MKSDFFFDDRALSFALALLVWSLLWGGIDAALRAPPNSHAPVPPSKAIIHEMRKVTL